jgi:moderate conductance mechanosensitive channel
MLRLRNIRLACVARTNTSVALLVCLLALATGAQAAAPMPTGTASAMAKLEVPTDLGSAQVGSFVAPLSDQQARQLLIEQLQTRTQRQLEQSKASSFADLLIFFRTTLATLALRSEALGDAWERLPGTFERMILLLTDLEGIEALWPGLARLVAMLVAGVVAAIAFNRSTVGVTRRLAASATTSTLRKLGFLSARLLLDVLALGVFVVVAIALSFALFESVNPMRLLAVTYVSVVAFMYFAWVLARFVFAPHAPDQRLWSVTDTCARRNARVLLGLSAIVGVGFFSAGFLEIIGADEATLALLRLFNVAIFGLVLAVNILTSEQQADSQSSWFSHWRLISFLFLVLVCALWSLNVVLGLGEAIFAAFLSVVLVLSLPTIDRLLVRVEQSPDSHEKETKIDRHALLLRVSVLGLLAAAALLLLVEVAGGAILAWFATPLGSAVGGAVIKVLAAFLLASLVWGAARALIDTASARELAKAQALAAEDGEGDGEGGNMIVGTRALTLLPLLRGTVFALIVAITAMVALSSIGIDIGPLLAGAGVIGLAIGFGAQALVRDVVSGVFFLIDDAFRIGEYIEIEELRGEVEKISIRSMQLRHHRGPVQTVPFGEIKSITNYNRDWVIYKQEFRLPYDVETEKVRKLVKKLGQSMLENPEYGHHFLEPLKSQGVRRIEDSAIIVGTKFMCKPRKQFVLRRHVFQNVQQLFRDNGIEFATRRVIVESSAKGGKEDAAAGAEAAAEALAAEQAQTTPSAARS